MTNKMSKKDLEREVQIDNPEGQLVVMYPPDKTSDEKSDTLTKSPEKQNKQIYKTRRVKKKSKSANDGERKKECDICGNIFSSANALSLHMKIHLEKKSYICDVCGRAFRRSHHLKSHQLSHEGKKTYVCDQCGSRYAEKRGLKNHMAVHNGNKNFTCDICGKSFWHKDGLRKHIHRVHNSDPPRQIRKRSDECEICGKTFVDWLTLKRHVYIHTGEKEASCPICKKEFTRRSSLKRHTKRRHNPFRVKKKREGKGRKKKTSESSESVNTTGAEKGIEQSGNNEEFFEVGSKIKTEKVSSDSESDHSGSVDKVTGVELQDELRQSGDHQHYPVLLSKIKKEFDSSSEEDTIPYCDSECDSMEGDDQYSPNPMIERETASSKAEARAGSSESAKLAGSGVRVAVTLGPGISPSVQIKYESDATGTEVDDELLEPMEQDSR